MVTEEGQTINMRSISNARELGGYKTIGGKTVRKGVLLRSAALTDASQEELDSLIRDYKLSAVIDIRASYELAEEPEPVLDSVAQYNFKIMDEQMMAQRAAGIYQVLKDPNVDPIKRMTAILDAGVISDQMYVEFLQGETGKTGFRDFFRVLLETPEGSSVLWHCTNGKDRTGVAAMLLPLGEYAALTGLILVGLGCAPIYPCIIHSTPKYFGQENSQAVIGVQMASAYVGTLSMPPLFGLIAKHISISLFPVVLLAILVLMAWMHEGLVKKGGYLE